MPTPRELFAAFRHCALCHDGDGLAALCTDDVVLELPFSRLRFRGRSDVRDWLATRRITGFEDIRLIDGGATLVAEYDLAGYVDDRPFRMGVVTMLEARHGKIASLRRYSDLAPAQVAP